MARGPKKVSDYGLQLKEKQKLRNTYGMRETQFKNFYVLASKFRGQTGQKLLEILEKYPMLDKSLHEEWEKSK